MKKEILKHPYLRQKFYFSNKRYLTNRGVLWVGLLCDLKCIFCYDSNYNMVKKEWLPFEGNNGLKNAVEKFRFFYKNQYIDLMGGEPTLYPDIFRLIKYCHEIQLFPTVITHGLHLSQLDFAKKFMAAGINDFLISIHGLGTNSDQIYGVKNKNILSRQIKAMENLEILGIPFRCNVTITTLNTKELTEIARLCISHGCLVINFIVFNPYFEWEKFDNIWFQNKFTEIVPYLTEAIQYCRANNIEVNVRYLPICLIKGLEEHIYTGFQLPYDSHEWDFNSWYDLSETGGKNKSYYFKLSQDQRIRHHYVYGETCMLCSVRNICDGFHSQYVNRWGFDEANPYSGRLINTPIYFIKKQKKIILESVIKFHLRSSIKTKEVHLSQFDKNTNRAGINLKD